MKEVKNLPEKYICGAKRVRIRESDYTSDWFIGYGTDKTCQLCGDWWDMICFARNVLSSENTRIVAPEFYKPEWRNNNYYGEQKPYIFVEDNN